jgi:hypothetical protein
MRQVVYETEAPYRRIRRIELVGKEGGVPPIWIIWEDAVTNEWFGTYRVNDAGYVTKIGPMFDG